MNLEKKHMLENNRTCMILGFLIQAFMFAATILYREGRAFPTVVMLIVEVICLIVSIVGYMKLGQHEAGHYPLLISLAVDYLFVLFGSFHTPYLWAFGALIGMVVIVYDDLHICKLACICALSENAIFVIIYYVAGFAKASASRYMVPSNMAFVVIFVIICYQVSATNSRQRTESLEDIERNQAEIEQKTAIIADTSEKISVKLEDADVAMAGLSEKVQASAEAVEQISSSVTMTAEAIQTQTEMNANITKSLDNISNESNEMEALAGVVKENVSEGNVIITELQKQAEETASVNKQTMAMTNELAKSAETVQEIVSAILTISNQTNLLALNASIEAARAGEAGKGFAVVADEIRKLSEDTKKSAEMISSTISDLKKSVDTASENMGASVESANKQGELIKETGSKFNDILVSVNELAKNVEKIADNVHECAEATSKVTDAISDLSAMSEEVAASSESSLTLSNACVEDMNTTNAILEEILKLSRQS